ncbi:unnamed protein product [Sphagnum jensenii]|uniref:Uncharacterized protein n=1 Tax=Sphagnum jensenii TaxID=128206 RepID=A0ABP0VGS3_9BRYO
MSNSSSNDIVKGSKGLSAAGSTPPLPSQPPSPPPFNNGTTTNEPVSPNSGWNGNGGGNGGGNWNNNNGGGAHVKSPPTFTMVNYQMSCVTACDNTNGMPKYNYTQSMNTINNIGTVNNTAIQVTITSCCGANDNCDIYEQMNSMPNLMSNF